MAHEYAHKRPTRPQSSLTAGTPFLVSMTKEGTARSLDSFPPRFHPGLLTATLPVGCAFIVPQSDSGSVVPTRKHAADTPLCAEVRRVDKPDPVSDELCKTKNAENITLAGRNFPHMSSDRPERNCCFMVAFCIIFNLFIKVALWCSICGKGFSPRGRWSGITHHRFRRHALAGALHYERTRESAWRAPPDFIPAFTLGCLQLLGNTAERRPARMRTFCGIHRSH